MSSKPTTKIFDVIVIGGGQAGLAVGYYLRRASRKQTLDFIILDNQPKSGGAWQHFWPSLRLFSPASVSSLPGRMMTFAEAGNLLGLLEQSSVQPVFGATLLFQRLKDGRHSKANRPTPRIMPAQMRIKANVS